jgi:hypothetical protein
VVNMIEVQSSNIHSIGYDDKKRELFVKFVGDGNRTYKYLKVPLVVWESMLRAPSKGKFLKDILVQYFQVTRISDGGAKNIRPGTGTDKGISN